MKGVKKLRAFTLSEMLVVLLLTVIVVGLAFSVLNLVQRQMSGIESNYARNTAFDQLKQSLWVDF
ncbi:MAG: prepilin-type N-terminal cleavage/methylation domain-containing protein, partial [Bacteroidota bacterium]